ncbi:MAG: helicase-related protein [Armatimonadota bacterium]|nr:helicase-related protein [Armatimonadota bacterium]
MVRVGDRVAVRDRPWRVEAARDLGGGKTLLTLLPVRGDGLSPLSVVTPPERVVPLPPEELRFDPAGIGPVVPWLRAHQALALTAIEDGLTAIQEGALSGARFGRVTLEAYQIAPVLRILAKPKPRLLIADDVGLGKTIEAGLCLLELMSRHRADRVLIVVPPGLIVQWQEEMLDRFGLKFIVIENAAGLAREQTELPAGVSPWDLPQARIITSMDYLKKDEVRRRALARPWDVVIVDEAHALAESGSPQSPYRTRRTRLGEDLRDRSRGLLLLTATPHNGYSRSFRSLIELVEPTAATLTGSQTRDRIERAMIRRMKRQIVRPDPQDGWIPVFPKRTVTPIPVKVSAREAELFRMISAYCSRTASEARGEEDEELISFAMQIIKKRAISSRLALVRTLENRLRALKREEEREEKPERSELRDYQAGLPLSDQQAERISRRILRSAIPKDERRRRTEVRKITEIQRLLAKLPPADPKVMALIAHLRAVLAEDPSAKVIVFTEYLDTLEAIRSAFGEAGPPLAAAHVELRGGLTMRQRQQRQQRFEAPEVRVLLATDAASEGLNLQRACHRLVHFELPWNPNRLEQRNGRIDRYGQAHPPDIRYLHYPDSPEDDVLARLVKKIEEMAEARVSTPDVLGVGLGLDLERRLVQVDPGDPAAADRLLRDFEDRTGEFVGEVQPLLLPSGDPGDEIRCGQRALTQAVPLLGDDLELEQFLLDILGPTAVRQSGEEGVFRIEVPRVFRGPGVAERYERATVRRSIAARTRPTEVEYLTPLHPLVQAIAAEARRRFIQVYPDDRGLPPRRLAARRIPAGERAGILFTFYGTIRGREDVIEEAILPVRVDLNGTVTGDLETDSRILRDRSRPGEVPVASLAPYGERFDNLLRAARTEAARRLAARAEQIRTHRRDLAERLRVDAEAYRADRLRELEEEEIRARGLLKDTGQVLLRIAEEPTRYSIDARRAAVEAHLKARLEEIEAFAQVDEPEPPQPVGALVLVPEGQ